jgi:23S rRNA (adenine2030-N6)-methyltransferase
MLSYRHGFHAGNFADVWKHLALVLSIDHLRLKEAPFRILDVFAGIGTYDLSSDEAARSPEWQDGIARFWAAENPPAPDSTMACTRVSPRNVSAARFR